MKHSRVNLRTASSGIGATALIVVAVCAPRADRAPGPRPVDGNLTTTEPRSPSQAIESLHLPNAHRVHDRVISGGAPDGREAFVELKRLGVRTVISVDGLKPNVALAREFGLRYVHLPLGYDGIPQTRACELAKAVVSLPAPIYVHCHHGRHRGPAAAVVACIGAGLIPKENGTSILRAADTSRDYGGLFRAVENASPMSRRNLEELDVEFRETVDPPATVAVMTQLDATLRRLESMSRNRWQPPPDHPDVSPTHEALLLKEQFVEFQRAAASQKRHKDFLAILEASRVQADRLISRLRDEKAAPFQHDAALENTASVLRSIGKRCRDCHRRFRN